MGGREYCKRKKEVEKKKVQTKLQKNRQHRANTKKCRHVRRRYLCVGIKSLLRRIATTKRRREVSERTIGPRKSCTDCSSLSRVVLLREVFVGGAAAMYHLIQTADILREIKKFSHLSRGKKQYGDEGLFVAAWLNSWQATIEYKNGGGTMGVPRDGRPRGDCSLRIDTPSNYCVTILCSLRAAFRASK